MDEDEADSTSVSYQLVEVDTEDEYSDLLRTSGDALGPRVCSCAPLTYSQT